MPSPTATPQSPAAATQPTTATATPTPLSTPNPLATGQATTPAGTQTTGAKENPLQARTGSHTVTFTSQPGTQGMPASQTIPDGKTAVPPQPTPTGLTIDNVALPLRQTGTGTWQATTTVHDPGPVPAQVRWTLAGQPQPDDTTYTYRHTGTLPNAGVAGIILLITAGMLGIATGNANRHRRTPTTTNTSPE